MRKTASLLLLGSLLGLAGCPGDILGAAFGFTSESVAACENIDNLDECSDCCTNADDKYTGAALEFGYCECTYSTD